MRIAKKNPPPGAFPEIPPVRSIQKIKPHYRSEGPRQGSCGVFGGSTTLSALFTRVYSPNDVLCH